MRIAVCLSGMLRNFESTHSTFNKYISEIYKPDIFFFGYPNNNGKEYCNKKLIELYNPKKFLLQDYTEELRNIICSNESKFKQNCRLETKINNTISQFYNIYNCDLLRQEYEKQNKFIYDVVIRSRTDVYYYKSFEKHELLLASMGHVLIPTEWDFKNVSSEAVSDSFAMTNSRNMTKYSNIYNKYESYYNNGCLMHPESLLGKHLITENLMRIEVKGHGWYKFENLDTGKVNERYGY